MKLYLRVADLGGLTQEQEECWNEYGGVGHATYSKELMTFKEICWEYFTQDIGQDVMYNPGYADKVLTRGELYEQLKRIEPYVKKAISELVKYHYLKEFE